MPFSTNTIQLTSGDFIAICATAITLLLTVAGGVWKIASLLSDIRNLLDVGRRRMNSHERRLNDHGRRLNKLDGETEVLGDDD